IVDDRIGQERIESRLRRGSERRSGLDRAGRGLQNPVAAERGRAGRVGRSGDIGAGEAGEGVDELLAGRGGGGVAWVELKIAAGSKRLADLLEGIGILRERRLIQHGRANIEQTRSTMADYRDR